MSDEPQSVLILRTGNSARSIMAEAITNREGRGRWRACSAGSRPAGEPNRFALERLKAEGCDTGFARSKSWDEFEGEDAPHMDREVTVDDDAARETCPLWPGAPTRAHRGVPNPAAANGSETQRRAAFEDMYRRLHERITGFPALPDGPEDGAIRGRDAEAIEAGAVQTEART